MGRMEPTECSREQVGERRRAGPARQRPAVPAPQVGYGLLGTAQQPDRLPGEGLDQSGSRAWVDASPTAFEQPDPPVRLQSLEMLGDGGLADVAGLRRPAHTPVVENCKEQLQAVQSQTGFCHKV